MKASYGRQIQMCCTVKINHKQQLMLTNRLQVVLRKRKNLLATSNRDFFSINRSDIVFLMINDPSNMRCRTGMTLNKFLVV